MSGYTSDIFDQSMAGFFSCSKSAFLDYRMRQELVSKSRVLCSKVPLARAIINIFVRGVIGSGLHLSESDDLFEFLSASYSLDASKSLDFFQIQQQAFETMLTSGECWLIRQLDKNEEFSSWYIAEPDHVFTPPYICESSAKRRIIDGVEFDANGCASAIYYCKTPFLENSNKRAWTKIKFFDKDGLPNVLQLKLTDRPEYNRGLPILTPLIETLFSLYAYNKAQIQMGIVQSCQAIVVITNTDPTRNPFSALSREDLNAPLIPTNDEEKKNSEFQITPPNNRDTFGVVDNATYVKPGQSVHLRPGEDAKFLTPSGPSNSLIEYYSLVVEQCGATLGIPKAMLSGVFDSSFSSSKASIAQWQYTISKFRKTFIEQVLKPIYRTYLAESGIALQDAFMGSIKSEWVSYDPPILCDEVRTMELLKTAYKMGLINLDEVAQTLFGHKAHPDPTWKDDFLSAL